MKDYIRENMSYVGLDRLRKRYPKIVTPDRITYGADKDQYFFFFEPLEKVSDKVIVWVHGGGWNAGDPDYFEYVGQCFAKHGYRSVSVGYRLSPKNKFPCQIEDVCACYNKALEYMRNKGISTEKIIIAGPSAGAHLSSMLCYSEEIQKRYNVDMRGVIGYIGSGGPYSFREKQGFTLDLLTKMLFEKGYDRAKGEPVKLISSSKIPALLIQSRHDGLVPFECAEDFKARADLLGIPCEIYEVVDKENTHSWYTAGMFLKSRETNRGLDKFFSFIEGLV